MFIKRFTRFCRINKNYAVSGLFAFVFFAAFHTILCVSWALGQDEPVPVKTIERTKATTIPIAYGVLTNEGGFQKKGIAGSAFFINDEGYFITATHVLDGSYGDTTQAIKEEYILAVYIIISRLQNGIMNAHWFKFNDCIKNTDADIAVCRPDTNPFTVEEVKRRIGFATFKKSPNIKDGMPVAFTGFPLDSLRPITAKGNIASYDEIKGAIIIDNSAWPGVSGSPVYLFDGKVIGIVLRGGINEASGLAVARYSESITKFLAENKIRFEQER